MQRTQAVVATPQIVTTADFARTIVAPRGRVCEQPANGLVRELASEDPGRQEGEQDRPTDRHRLAEQVEVGGPIGCPRGELRLRAKQPQRSGSLGVLEDGHEQAHDQWRNEKPMATPHGTRERRALSISVRRAATKTAHDSSPPSPVVNRMK